MEKRSTLLFALILTLGGFSSAYADSYTYTTLDYPGASAGTTDPQGINDAGTIVGSYNQYLGFILSNGTYTSLKVPDPSGNGYDETIARGINNAGAIVGQYASSGWPGFILSGGTYTTLNSSALAINNTGTILMYSSTLSGGIYTPLPNPPDPGLVPYLNAWGINDAGTIVGYFLAEGYPGFVLSNGTYTLLNSGALARGINNAGTIVGTIGTQGFVLSNGIYTPLTYPGASATYANGINNLGQIVGQYVDTSGVGHGFLAIPTQQTSVPVPAMGNWGFLAAVCGLLWLAMRRKERP